ncbi:MAG: glycosyltransferase [Bacteroidales bacterium]
MPGPSVSRLSSLPGREQGLQEEIAIILPAGAVAGAVVIIGSGNLMTQIQKQIAEADLTDTVICMGQIPYSQLFSYTCGAVLGVSLEEHIGLNYYYALPNKIFDYIQSHVPILVSDLPEMKNIVTQYMCGEIVQQRNPYNLAQQMMGMLSDTEKYNRYEAHAKQAASVLNWEHEEKKLLAVYADVCDA